MHPKLLLPAATAILPLALCSCALIFGEDTLTIREQTFVAEVKPLLEKRCLPCHNGRVAEGQLDLSSRETAFRPGADGKPRIVPGEPAASKILTVVLAAVEHPQAMPPTGHGLGEIEIETLDTWIRHGAIWPREEAGELEPAPGSEPRSR